MAAPDERKLVPIAPESDGGRKEPSATDDSDLSTVSMPPEVAAALQHMPPQVRAFFQTSIERYSGPPLPPKELLDKVTSEHISTVLSNAEKSEERRSKDTRHGRWFTLVYVLVVIAAVVAFTLLTLTCKAESGLKERVLDKVLDVMVGLVGGFGGGYWYASTRQRN